MTENARSPWGNGDELAAKAAEEVTLEAGKTTELPKARRADAAAEGMMAMLEQMAGVRRSGESDKLPDSEKVSMLKQASHLYVVPATNRFKTGDLVTPNRTAVYRGKGQPHIVLEVRSRIGDDGAIDTATTDGDPSSNTFGRKLDLRVARVDGDGEIACFWVEAFMFEPWTAPVAKAA